jgi:hypothetical protein
MLSTSYVVDEILNDVPAGLAAAAREHDAFGHCLLLSVPNIRKQIQLMGGDRRDALLREIGAIQGSGHTALLGKAGQQLC